MRWHCTGIFWQDKIDLFLLRGKGENWIKNKVLQKSECTTNETLVLPTKYPSLTLQPLPVIQIFPHLPLRLMEWFHLNFLNIISLSSVIKLKGRKNLIISCFFCEHLNSTLLATWFSFSMSPLFDQSQAVSCHGGVYLFKQLHPAFILFKLWCKLF